MPTASGRGSGSWSSTTSWPRAGRPPPRTGLVQQLGGVIAGITVLMELSFLAGRERLDGTEVRALVSI